MKKIAQISVLIVLFMVYFWLLAITCFAGEYFTPLSKRDIALEATWLTLHAADYAQTIDITNHPDRYRELNVFLGQHPTKNDVSTFFVANGLLHVGIVWALPAKYRLAFQGGSILGKSLIVISNHRIGLGFAWPF